MDVKKTTISYETWLAARTIVVQPDLALKHEQMSKNLFSFLRATFYHWVQAWPEVCPDLTNAPQVLAVGDLHIENFGTWRDAEGRLAWGINDFDEAHALPYTNDLLRLAVSAHLGIAANHLALLPEDACDAIMEGYTAGLEAGGSPFVLAEQRPRLRDMVASEKRDPAGYWKKFDSLPTITEVLPASAKKALEAVLPDNKMDYRVAHRTAGLGSLGRQRFLAIGEWRGGKIAREAKALVPSACTWAGNKASHQSMQLKALNQAVRSHDPFITVQDGWIVRRLAPDCSRIEWVLYREIEMNTGFFGRWAGKPPMCISAVGKR